MDLTSLDVKFRKFVLKLIEMHFRKNCCLHGLNNLGFTQSLGLQKKFEGLIKSWKGDVIRDSFFT